MIKKVVVTGGAGFIGSHIVDLLLEKDYQVFVVDDLSSGKKENLNSKCNFVFGNLLDVNLENLFCNVDTVFHCAAFPRVQTSIEDPVFSNSVNIDATLRVLMAAKNSFVRRVVFSSSSSVYGESDSLPTVEDSSIVPISPYALQKYVGEEYCRIFSYLYGLETVSLRYFNVYGDRMSDDSYPTVLGIFKRQIKSNLPLTITNDGNQKRDFTHVKDVAKANILAMNSSFVGRGEAINIGSATNYSINDIVRILNKEKVYIGSRKEPKETLADIEKSKNLLGWAPTFNFLDWLKFDYIKNI